MSFKFTDTGSKALGKAIEKAAQDHLKTLVQTVATELRRIRCPEHGPLSVTVIGNDVKSGVCCEPVQKKVDMVLSKYK